MCDFFDNKDFVNKIALMKHKKETILMIMKEIKNNNQD